MNAKVEEFINKMKEEQKLKELKQREEHLISLGLLDESKSTIKIEYRDYWESGFDKWDEEKGKYVLGIECDDGNYHNLKNVKDRDIARQAFLESRGWNIHRIWGVYWWKDKEGVLNKIKEILDSNK